LILRLKSLLGAKSTFFQSIAFSSILFITLQRSTPSLH